MLTRLVIASTALLALAPSAVAAPAIHAHRGGTVLNGKPRYAEESTRAYRNAARNGFVLEVDAKLTEDGVPVAIHDATLDRTTNCSGEVRTFTLPGARRLQDRRARQPGQPAPHEAGAPHRPIPRSPTCSSSRRRTGAEVNLEIKNVPTDPDFDTTPAYANRVMDAVLASGIPRRQLIVQSFIAANLDVARQRLPGVRTSLLSVQSINDAVPRRWPPTTTTTSSLPSGP